MDIDINKYNPKQREQGDPRKPRDEMINKFLAKRICRKNRRTENLEVLTARDMAILLSVYKTTDELHDLYTKCDAKSTESFSKLFWWHLNPKNHGNEKTNN
jgi:hypothetical protein